MDSRLITGDDSFSTIVCHFCVHSNMSLSSDYIISFGPLNFSLYSSARVVSNDTVK